MYLTFKKRKQSHRDRCIREGCVTTDIEMGVMWPQPMVPRMSAALQDLPREHDSAYTCVRLLASRTVRHEIVLLYATRTWCFAMTTTKNKYS